MKLDEVNIRKVRILDVPSDILDDENKSKSFLIENIVKDNPGLNEEGFVSQKVG